MEEGGSNPCLSPDVGALEKYWNRSRHFSKEQNIGLSCLQIGYGHGINDFEFMKDFKTACLTDSAGSNPESKRALRV